MSQFAIIQLAGKQHKVSVGDVVITETHQANEGENVVVTDVLMVGDDTNVTVGQPTVAKAKVELKVLKLGHNPKVEVRTYRSKSRYRRHQGHKQPQTRLEVTKISL